MKFGRMMPTQREIEIYELWKTGRTLQYVGDKYRVSREYIRQILKRNFNITCQDNTAKINMLFISAYLKKRNSLKRRRETRQNHIHKMFGCHEEILIYINGGKFTCNNKGQRGIAGKYLMHKKNAAARGIDFSLSLPEWWEIWRESGKYHLRGVGAGYGMARYADNGGYEKGNVYICTASENATDMHLYKPDDEIKSMREKQRQNSQKSHCIRGHEMSGNNLYIHQKSGNRHCRECDRIRSRSYYIKIHQLQASAQ